MADKEEMTDIDSTSGTYAWLHDNHPDWSMNIKQALSPIEELQTLAYSKDIGLILAINPAPWQVAAEASNDKSVAKEIWNSSKYGFWQQKPFEIVQKYAQQRKNTICESTGELPQEPATGNSVFDACTQILGYWASHLRGNSGEYNLAIHPKSEKRACQPKKSSLRIDLEFPCKSAVVPSSVAMKIPQNNSSLVLHNNPLNSHPE